MPLPIRSSNVSENDFHHQVLSALSDLKVDLAETNAELRAVAARMDAHADTIAEHQQAIGKLQIEIAERRLNCPLAAGVKDDLATHKLDCPLRARMDAVEDFVVATRAMAVSNGRWISKLMPVVYAAAGIGVYLVLVHSTELLKYVQQR
jgi:hypothetical protein